MEIQEHIGLRMLSNQTMSRDWFRGKTRNNPVTGTTGSRKQKRSLWTTAFLIAFICKYFTLWEIISGWVSIVSCSFEVYAVETDWLGCQQDHGATFASSTPGIPRFVWRMQKCIDSNRSKIEFIITTSRVSANANLDLRQCFVLLKNSRRSAKSFAVLVTQASARVRAWPPNTTSFHPVPV